MKNLATEAMNRYKAVKSRGAIIWDAVEADIIIMEITMIIVTAMKAGDLI